MLPVASPKAILTGTGQEQQENSKNKYNQQLKPKDGTASQQQEDTTIQIGYVEGCSGKLLDYVKKYALAMSMRKDIGDLNAYAAGIAENIIKRGGLCDKDWNYLNKMEGKNGHTANSSSRKPETGITGSGAGGASDIDSFISGLAAG
ncbi:MAG: hypothetical protein RBR06_10165 [Desulfuromonadaceae bacterium]|nr:hypothetical protein [Desulfuromonadaceae bacterium]